MAKVTRTTLIAFAVAFPCFAEVAHGEVARPSVPHQVLAFYYGWYGNPTTSGRWIHWEKVDAAHTNIGSSTHYPVLGAYDCHDPAIAERHCRDAKTAGLSGFIATWWGRDDFTDRGLPVLLDAAKKNGLAVTVYYETAHPDHGSPYDNALADILYLLKTYGNHPACLKVKDKPVIFVYGRAIEELKLKGWEKLIAEVNASYPGGAVFVGDQISTEAARVFDGIHTYNITGQTAGKSLREMRAWARKNYRDWIHIAGTERIACVTVIPGYDDTKTGREPPRPITDRHGGDTYRVLWEEAMITNPDWVLLTSWNEWHEGSEIEPSVENGDRELKTTGAFAPKFRAQLPR